MTIKIDIMLYGEIYYHTLKYESKSPFPPSKEELREFAMQKLPSLRNKDFEVYVCSSKKIRNQEHETSIDISYRSLS